MRLTLTQPTYPGACAWTWSPEGTTKYVRHTRMRFFEHHATAFDKDPGTQDGCRSHGACTTRGQVRCACFSALGCSERQLRAYLDHPDENARARVRALRERCAVGKASSSSSSSTKLSVFFLCGEARCSSG